jgi:hypothetical protein
MIPYHHCGQLRDRNLNRDDAKTEFEGIYARSFIIITPNKMQIYKITSDFFSPQRSNTEKKDGLPLLERLIPLLPPLQPLHLLLVHPLRQLLVPRLLFGPLALLLKGLHLVL